MSTSQIPEHVKKQRAKDLLNQGRVEDARALLAELCSDDQRDIETWSLYSTANGYLERYEDVISACHKMLDIEPDYLPALNNLASSLAALGRYDESSSEFDKLMTLAPDNPAVLNNYGRGLVLMGRLVEARNVLEKAVQIQPHYAEARFNLALMMESLGEYAEALRHYEQVASLKPGTPGLDERLSRMRELVQSENG